MVKHHIGVDLYAQPVADFDGGQILIPGAVFGPDAALLIKLTKIKQVVAAVADVVATGIALGGWRQP